MASRRTLTRYAAAWLVATSAAVATGVLAVGLVGGQLRDRGPLGNEAARQAELAEGSAVPRADAEVVTQRFAWDFGRVEATCQGAVASITDVTAARAAGWRTVSFEPGPDDDVDVVFSSGARSVDLELFCNRGRPTVSELERNTLPDGED